MARKGLWRCPSKGPTRTTGGNLCFAKAGCPARSLLSPTMLLTATETVSPNLHSPLFISLRCMILPNACVCKHPLSASLVHPPDHLPVLPLELLLVVVNALGLQHFLPRLRSPERAGLGAPDLLLRRGRRGRRRLRGAGGGAVAASAVARGVASVLVTPGIKGWRGEWRTAVIGPHGLPVAHSVIQLSLVVGV